jgi:hypothetical protein
MIDTSNPLFEIDPRVKPRIVEMIETFEKQFFKDGKDSDKVTPEEILDTACIAVAMFLFGPLTEEFEVEMYAAAIKTRVIEYLEDISIN